LNGYLHGDCPNRPKAAIHNHRIGDWLPDAKNRYQPFVARLRNQLLKGVDVAWLHPDHKPGFASVDVPKYLLVDCRKKGARPVLNAPIFGLLSLDSGNFLIRFHKALLQAFNFGFSARFSVIKLSLQTILLLLSLCGGDVLGCSNKLVFAQAVEVRDDLGTSQSKETYNPEPKPEMRPESRTVGVIPSRPPSHDYLPLLFAMEWPHGGKRA
jgi:hypothetical protein